MAEDFNVAAPYPLINPRRPMGRTRGGYDTGLAAGSQWAEWDLVEINASGNVQKCVQTTPANIRKLAFAPAPYSIAPLDSTRHAYYTDRDVPLECLTEEHLVVFTYQGATANGSDHTFVTADNTAVVNQEERELVYNATEGVLTIRAGTTNPNVRMKYVAKGAVGDANVRVACQVLGDFRLEV